MIQVMVSSIVICQYIYLDHGKTKYYIVYSVVNVGVALWERQPDR